MPKDNLLSVLFKSAGQGVSSAPAWKERTNLDKIRQRQEERADERLEMDKTQQEMKRTELINRLEAGLKQQEQEVMDKEFEQIVFRDAKGAVDKGWISEEGIQQNWPSLWQREFDPAYKMDLDAKRLKAMYEANEEARKQQKHEYDMNQPYSGTGDSKTGVANQPKTVTRVRQDLFDDAEDPKKLMRNPPLVDSLLAAKFGAPPPEFIQTDTGSWFGGDDKYKRTLSDEDFFKSLQETGNMKSSITPQNTSTVAPTVLSNPTQGNDDVEFNSFDDFMKWYGGAGKNHPQKDIALQNARKKWGK